MHQFKLTNSKKYILLIIYSIPILFLATELIVRADFTVKKKDINLFRPSYYFTQNIISDKRRFKSHPFLPFFPKEFDSRRIYLFKPLINKTITYDYSNNSLGFRTPERPYRKPDGTKRVVILGGSSAWDGPSNDITWPALLEKKLNQYYAAKNIQIEVINLSMDAGISQMSLTILNTYGVMYQPDLVISYDGTNDVLFAIYTSNILPDFSNYVQPFDDRITSVQMVLPVWSFNSYAISYLSSVIDTRFMGVAGLPEQVWKNSKTSSDKSITSGMPLYLRNIKLMRGTCREYACRFVASIPHTLSPESGEEAFNDMTREYFKRENIDYLDLESILPHNDVSFHVDANHWTEKGLMLVSDEWVKKIVNENLLEI